MRTLQVLEDCAAHGIPLAAGPVPYPVDDTSRWEGGVRTGEGVPVQVATALVAMGRARWGEEAAPEKRTKSRWESKG